jgi:hypothetical protein
MPTQAADLAFGRASELNVMNSLQRQFNTELVYGGNYATMDYHNKTNTMYIELKTRRITHDKYETAIIGHNKIKFCSDDTKQYYFCFAYEDGLYYIQYDKAVFDAFRVEENYRRSFRPDTYNPLQTVIHIPTNLLRRFSI